MTMIYLSSPLSTPAQREANANLAKALAHKFQVYLPQRDGGLYAELCHSRSKAAAAAEIYSADTAALFACDIVVARIEQNDPGVQFEIGYAAALHKQVIGLYSGPSSALDPKVWQGCKALFFTMSEFWAWVALQE
jgi:nucleoside 2-deoxyribosyltransferase